MDKKHNIVQYRERLDRTLASPKLTNVKTLKSLVKNQILQSSGQETEGCSETVIEKRTDETSNFLDMLRSVSGNGNEGSKTRDTASHPEWKLKQDNEEFRVMYREGPEGSPFHSLLVEGYVDGPLDVYVSHGSQPSTRNAPTSVIRWHLLDVPWVCGVGGTLRVNAFDAKLCTISAARAFTVDRRDSFDLERVKVSWPLSTREAVVHYFLFEYLEDDLLVVILNTVSDSVSITSSTHGFTNDAIPKAKDAIRIDLVGGFALQKVTPERSYFRTIASMDMKLDFVPPSLINFISRQLIGNGFRLYQKAVATMFTSDEDFSKALRDSLYTRIREALFSTNQLNGSLAEEELRSNASDLSEEHTTNNLGDLKVMDQEVNCDYHAVESPVEEIEITGRTALREIEELKSEESKHFDAELSVEKITERSPVNVKRNIIISSEVEQALGTLEKVISMVREYGFKQTPSWFTSERSPKENDADEDSKSVGEGVYSNMEVHVEAEKEATERTSSQESVGNSSTLQNSRQGGSNSSSKEVNHSRIAPASPEQKLSVPGDDTNTNQVALSSDKDGSTELSTMQNRKHSNVDTNGIHESSPNRGKKPSRKKNYWFCCFGVTP
ncbi:START-like domain containing protein [Parasponia andersonii]|uniref:START-like domain containing protein n=1 Tax=Parasponia andersonii TaxID=3476 RepID=A0A2P5B010_PARAD|nr:START-like domain containing protein [Parasponia andersonii]